MPSYYEKAAMRARWDMNRDLRFGSMFARLRELVMSVRGRSM